MKTAIQFYYDIFGKDKMLDGVAIEFARAYAEQVRDEILGATAALVCVSGQHSDGEAHTLGCDCFCAICQRRLAATKLEIK